MTNFDFIDDAYPNGKRFQKVSLNGVSLGISTSRFRATPHLAGRPVAAQVAALEKLRAAGVAERKRQTAVLQAEIAKLAAA